MTDAVIIIWTKPPGTVQLLLQSQRVSWLLSLTAVMRERSVTWCINKEPKDGTGKYAAPNSHWVADVSSLRFQCLCLFLWLWLRHFLDSHTRMCSNETFPPAIPHIWNVLHFLIDMENSISCSSASSHITSSLKHFWCSKAETDSSSVLPEPRAHSIELSLSTTIKAPVNCEILRGRNFFSSLNCSTCHSAYYILVSVHFFQKFCTHHLISRAFCNHLTLNVSMSQSSVLALLFHR